MANLRPSTCWRAMALGIAAAWPTFCAVAQDADQLYVVTDIGTFSDSEGTRAYALNNYGQVVGSAPVDGDKPIAWHWQNDDLVDINDTVHFNYWFLVKRGEAYDVSDGDQIVGGGWYLVPGQVLPWRQEDLYVIQAYVARPATASDFGDPYPGDSVASLGALGADIWLSSCATAISNANHVVGWADVRIEDPAPNYVENVVHAFLVVPTGNGFFVDADHDGVNDLMVDLGTLASDDEMSSATDVNDSGVVVGYSYGPNAGYSAFRIVPVGGVWANLNAQFTNSMMQQLLPDLGGTNSWARGINNAGLIVGEADTSDLDTHAFIWREGVGMTDLGTLGGDDSSAAAINSDGVIVGWAEDTERTRHAVMWVPDGAGGYDIVDLNDQVILTRRWKLTEARDINDSGEITGWGSYTSGTDGELRAYLLEIPTAEDLALLETDSTDGSSSDGSSGSTSGGDDLNLDPIFPDATSDDSLSPIVPMCGFGALQLTPLMLVGLLGAKRRYSRRS